jgi:hypothetical protein
MSNVRARAPRARCTSGKSALLGNILVYGNPGLRELLVRHRFINNLAEHQRSPDGAFTEVVHLTGLTTAELVKRLLSVLGSPQAGTTLNEPLPAVREVLVGLERERERLEVEREAARSATDAKARDDIVKSFYPGFDCHRRSG